ncbi:ArsR/SmtB family transcription factor [Kribbella sancticallisti]|uniref:ArsR/SmtB family transcription factor n=1 Tax=Kribbella sancticallisti TaxID=460087 RepID=UPI0031D7541B
MIRFELGVDDLADTRFAISPAQETLFSLWVLRDPGMSAMHLPWRRSVIGELDALDIELLMALVGKTLALPDFLTPRPSGFAPSFEEQVAVIRATPAELVRRDLVLTHQGRLPQVFEDVRSASDARTQYWVDAICEVLRGYWEIALAPSWAKMRLVLEGDTTYRARQLAVGGARLLFADLNPFVEWQDGILRIDRMLGHHDVAASGRGLLLMPSIFAYKALTPLSADEAPWLAYPSRGVATLSAATTRTESASLVALLGQPRAVLLRMLDEPLPTIEIARRLEVTPSAVSQHLQVLHATNLVSRARDGRYLLYRRSALGDQLLG